MAEGSDPKPDHPLNYGFGALNPIEPPVISRRFTASSTTFMTAVREAAQEVFTPDAIASTGPYKAIVLRVEEQPDSDAGSAEWLSSFLDGKKTNPPKMVRIKARIPELHSMLPIPTGDGNTKGPHQGTIDLYPTYTAQSDLVPEPAVGDLVWVNYGNKTNWSDPIYIRPLLEVDGIEKALGIDSIKSALAALGCGGLLGVDGPTGDSVAVKNQSAVPHQGPPKGARSVSEGDPKTIRGADANEQWAETWEKSSEKNNIPMISYVDRLASNGMRDLIIFAPLTTDFTKPVELAYVFHGSISWLTPVWIGSNGIWSKQLQEMILDGRNIVFVLPQFPWAKKQNSAAGGNITTLWDGEKGGSLSALHGDVLNVLLQHFSQDINIVYTSITAHSKGGDAVQIAAEKGQLAEIKPDKITMGDTYGRGRTLPIFGVFDSYVSKTDKYLEYNILCESPGTAKRTGKSGYDSTKKFFSEKLETVVDADAQQIVRPKYTVNYAPQKREHGAIAAIAVPFMGPAPPIPASSPGSGFAGSVSLDKVVVFGTSLIGGDDDGVGKLGKAFSNTIKDLGAREVVVRGVQGSGIRQWLGIQRFSEQRTKARSGGLSVDAIAQENGTLYFIAIGGNDLTFGNNDTKTSEFLGYARQVLDKVSPDKSKPIIWAGHIHSNTLEKSEKAQKLYRALDEELTKEYPNLVVVWPSSAPLREIYLSAGGKHHPGQEVHQRFLDATSDKWKGFLGVGTGKRVPDDNANASPEREQYQPGIHPGVGPPPDQAEICDVINDIVANIRQLVEFGEDPPEAASAASPGDVISLMGELGSFPEYVQKLNESYLEVDLLSPLSPEGPNTLEAVLPQVFTETEIQTIRQSLNSPAVSSGTPEAIQNRVRECETCRPIAEKFSPTPAAPTSPSERPGSSSTEGSGEITQTTSQEPVKYLDLIRAEAQRLQIEPEIALAFIQIEAGGKFLCPGGRMLVRFEPHKFIDGVAKFISDEVSKNVPWFPCKDAKRRTNCAEWKKLGYKHDDRCDQNWQVEHNKNIKEANDWAIANGAADDSIAYWASSFGGPQIMGFNYRLCGYSSPKELFNAFATSEVAQIRGLFAYLQNKPGMLSASQNKDFFKMARFYNGAGNESVYGPRLEAAYIKFKSGQLPENRQLVGSAGDTLPTDGGSTSSAGTAGTQCATTSGTSVGGGGGTVGAAGGAAPGGTGPIRKVSKNSIPLDQQFPADKKVPGDWEGWYNVFGRTIEDVTHVCVHETAGNGKALNSMRYVRDKGDSGLLHHYIDWNGTPWNLVKYDAWGWHGQMMNRVSVGWEAVNPVTRPPISSYKESYEREMGQALEPYKCKWMGRGDIWYPGLKWFETQWQLAKKIASECPNVPLKVVGMRNGGYYAYGGRGYSVNNMPPPGIIAHSHFFTKVDGAAAVVYMCLRINGLSPEQAWEQGKNRLIDWGANKNKFDPIDVTADFSGVTNDGANPPIPPPASCPPNTSCAGADEAPVLGPEPPPPSDGQTSSEPPPPTEDVDYSSQCSGC